MERTLPRPLQVPDWRVASRPRFFVLKRLLPLWRHAVWLLSFFAVLVAAAVVRLDVQQLRKDLDRNTFAQREARVLNDRLRLEVDARRRVTAMEAVAAQLQLGPEAELVDVRVDP